MKIRRGLDVVIVVVLILSIIGSGIEIYKNIINYGWTYTETIIVNGASGQEIVTNKVSVWAKLFATGFLCIIVYTLVTNVRNIEIGEIDVDTEGWFPHGKPEHWAIEWDSVNEALRVELGSHQVNIPLVQIKDWFPDMFVSAEEVSV